jgi:hypothetical protein
MGFKRKIAAAVAAALMAGVSPAAAAPSAEPLVITRLPDPEQALVRTAEPTLTVVRTAANVGDQPSFDQAMQSFGRAVDRAIRAEQQAMMAACKASTPPKPGSAQVYAWGARCSYDRR